MLQGAACQLEAPATGFKTAVSGVNAHKSPIALFQLSQQVWEMLRKTLFPAVPSGSY